MNFYERQYQFFKFNCLSPALFGGRGGRGKALIDGSDKDGKAKHSCKC